MYLEALEFLEDERESWRPYEALAGLPDEALARPTSPDSAAHGWSGLELMMHMVAWREIRLGIARELAVDELSAAQAALRERVRELGIGGINAALFAEWRSLPLP